MKKLFFAVFAIASLSQSVVTAFAGGGGVAGEHPFSTQFTCTLNASVPGIGQIETLSMVNVYRQPGNYWFTYLAILAGARNANGTHVQYSIPANYAPTAQGILVRTQQSVPYAYLVNLTYANLTISVPHMRPFVKYNGTLSIIDTGTRAPMECTGQM